MFLTILLALSLVGQANAQPQEATGVFTEIADNLYRVQSNNHHAMVLVTDEGVILSDPLNREFSEWLKEELKERFNAEVKYLLYSHHHWDHASGGAVFEDTAQFVGHENMLHHFAMPASDTTLPASAAALDSNENGQLERSEVQGGFERAFDLYDVDADGVINGAEATRGPLKDVRAPDLVYSERMTIRLGGQEVELIYTGDMTHTDDMSIIRFPEQRTIFLVDWVSPYRVPFSTLGEDKLDAWLNAIRFAEALDYDIAAGGHGIVGDKSHVAAFRIYLEELRDQVSEAIAAGQSLQEMQENIRMEPYSDWINYDNWVHLNVQGMYNLLSGN
jgi:glyoxylase-like metal-dependent hydrolase (beta-lactamase superfamily II)